MFCVMIFRSISERRLKSFVRAILVLQIEPGNPYVEPLLFLAEVDSAYSTAPDLSCFVNLREL